MFGLNTRSVLCLRAGNVLINVGPTQHGTIAPIFQERLLDLGGWLTVNGEAIYNSSPWDHQRDSVNADVWYTCRVAKSQDGQAARTANSVYAIFLTWPKDNRLSMKDVTSYLYTGAYKVALLGNDGFLNVSNSCFRKGKI